MDIAALIAWLVTAGSGAYVLGGWISHGGTLRRRAGSTGAPRSVVFGHFGLALSGLVIWVCYLATGWTALAWTAVGLLLPVAGLGMSMLTIGLPGLPSLQAQAATVSVGAGGPSPANGPAPATGGAGAAVSAKRRLSPLIVVGHGVLAVVTMLLVLLAALGVAAL